MNNWAVAVAQMVERLLPISENLSTKKWPVMAHLKNGYLRGSKVL